MVKRIKKRVAKKQDDATEAAVGADDDAGAAAAPDSAVLEPDAPVDNNASFRAELESLSEDEFTRTVAGGVSWVVDNRGLIIAGLGITAVVVVALFVMQGQKTSGVEEAATAFGDASEGYVEAVVGPRPGSDEKPLSAEERKARIEKAAQAFERTRQAYGEQPISHLSALGEAGTRLDLGETDKALTLYEQALSSPDLPGMTRAVALQGKAAALESKGDVDGAIAAWKALEGVDKDAFGLMAGLQVGRLLEAQGKGADAKALYERLQTEHAAGLDQLANRAVKADLERRVARLGRSS